MKMSADAEVIEPEIIPPGVAEPKAAENIEPGGVNPIIAGVLIDVINIFTFGFVGFIAGGAIGYWAARSNRLPLHLALLIALAVGWYCGLPLPRSTPLATIIGIIIVLWRKWGKS